MWLPIHVKLPTEPSGKPKRGGPLLTKPSAGPANLKPPLLNMRQRPQITKPAVSIPTPRDRLVLGWKDVTRRLSRTKGQTYNLGALLRSVDGNNIRVSADGAALELPFKNTPNADRMAEELHNGSVMRMVESAIEETYGVHYKVRIIRPN